MKLIPASRNRSTQFRIEVHLESIAENSKKALRKDWDNFDSYCDQKGISWKSIDTEVYLNYLKHKASTCKIASVKRYHSSLKKCFFLLPDRPEIDYMAIEAVLKRMQRRAGPQKQAEALTLDILNDIISKLDITTNRGKYQAALLSFMFDTALRRAEVGLINIDDLQMNNDGSATVDVHRTKTSGETETRYVSKESMKHLEQWLCLVNKTDGPIFCSLDRHNNVNHEPIAGITASRNIKSAAKKAGYNEDLFSGHSLRVGSAVSMAEANIDTTLIAQAGGWKSANTVLRYTRRVTASRNGIAQLRGEASSNEDNQ